MSEIENLVAAVRAVGDAVRDDAAGPIMAAKDVLSDSIGLLVSQVGEIELVGKLQAAIDQADELAGLLHHVADELGQVEPGSVLHL